MIGAMTGKILSGGEITPGEAIALGELTGQDLWELLWAARQVSRNFHGNKVDLCSIINAKSGRCSEDCAFCAQSSHYQTGVAIYPLLSVEEILERAKVMESKGARRFSLVTSGRGIPGGDFDKIIHIYNTLREKTGLGLCASLGIIDYKKALRLKEAGVSMYHHNIETSGSFYPEICRTHSFGERVETINSVREAGLTVCSGGIIGMGEKWEHRVEMAFQLKEMGISSVPLNLLTPIGGTPLWGRPVPAPLEALKTVAMFRLVLPGAVLRLAGGRESALRDLQSLALVSGVNGLMVGNYLTTGGRRVEDDLKMLEDLELEIM